MWLIGWNTGSRHSFLQHPESATVPRSLKIQDGDSLRISHGHDVVRSLGDNTYLGCFSDKAGPETICFCRSQLYAEYE